MKAGVGSPPAMTSGSGNNAPTVTGSTPQNGESKPPPQAIVKPQILTHVIEGFVIQEGAEPFPVSAYPICVCFVGSYERLLWLLLRHNDVTVQLYM